MRLEAAVEALAPVEPQEEGWRQLVAIQGVGWEQSCAVLESQEDSPCCYCVGKSQSFPFCLLGLSLEAAV